jgi:hypothetical protein
MVDARDDGTTTEPADEASDGWPGGAMELATRAEDSHDWRWLAGATGAWMSEYLRNESMKRETGSIYSGVVVGPSPCCDVPSRALLPWTD